MKLYIPMIAIALALPSAVAAQDFSGESTWSNPNFVGGVGPEGNSAVAGEREGTFEVTNADGSVVTGSTRCIGMEAEAPFSLRMSCDSRSEESLVSMALLCVWRGEPAPETPLSCVGFMNGKSGPVEGRGGMITMDWYETDRAHMVGQWWPAAE